MLITSVGGFFSRFVWLPVMLLCWCPLKGLAKTVAKTDAETLMTITMEGGKAVKKIPAGSELEVLQDLGDNLEVKDAAGLVGTVAKSSVTMAKIDEPKTEALPAVVSGTITTERTTASNDEEPPLAALNKAFGVELFADKDLWQDDATVVARRLGWPMESKTDTQSSYRLYAKSDTLVLGARPYSLVMYAHEGKPDSLSMVFANKGDFEGVSKKNEEKARSEAIKDFKDAVKNDAKNIESTLTAELGKPKRQLFGETPETRESVARWDWQNHAILLASPKDEYVAVRVVPKEVADNYGRAVKTEGLRDILQNRVVKCANGDAVVEQIPMVNQGPKGYCVPATWERYLRYMEIPADMYMLAMAGNTNIGGGTYIDELTANVDLYVRRYGCKIQTVDAGLDTRNISKYVDKGLPLMWACYVSDQIEDNINKRGEVRSKVTDWEGYIKELKTVKKEFRDASYRNRKRGHVRMIIGYNAKTGEIAISDSWGNWAAERWITVEEATSTSQDYLCIIKW